MGGSHRMAVFPRQGPVPADAGPLFHAWQRSGCALLAVSVLENHPGLPLALFLSGAELLPTGGWRLVPLLGFCEEPALCNALRRLGAPALEATLDVTPDENGAVRIEVRLPYWGSTPGALVDGDIALLDLLWPATSGQMAAQPVPVSFELRSASPDPVEPGSVLSLLSDYYDAGLASSLAEGHRATLKAAPARCPDLVALLGDTQPLSSLSTWFSQGPASAKDQPALLAVQRRRRGPEEFQHARIDAVSPLGHGRFIFDGVELIGFRFQVPDRRDLARLLQALNPTDQDETAPADFRYEAATATVVVELLRYASMRVADAQPPLTDQHSTCQHELLVRVLVGRVDDDTAQARDPATFMPVLFVDDVWSKWLGRELEGYPKELANFMVGDQVLRPDGCNAAQVKEPLYRVDQVKAWGSQGKPLLTLDYASTQFDENFDSVDIELLGGTALGGLSRWRQTDLSDKDVSRGFARDVVVGSQASFDTLQSTPVDGRDCEGRALIRGRASLSRLRMQYPDGLAELRLFRTQPSQTEPAQGPQAQQAQQAQQGPEIQPPLGSDQAWNLLIDLLGAPSAAAGAQGGPDAVLRCVTGEFYRARFDMRLDVLPSL